MIFYYNNINNCKQNITNHNKKKNGQIIETNIQILLIMKFNKTTLSSQVRISQIKFKIIMLMM